MNAGPEARSGLDDIVPCAGHLREFRKAAGTGIPSGSGPTVADEKLENGDKGLSREFGDGAFGIPLTSQFCDFGLGDVPERRQERCQRDQVSIELLN